MADLGPSHLPLSAAQILARLATVDRGVLAAVLANPANADNPAGIGVLLATTREAAREALAISNPTAAERQFRAVFMR